MKLAVAMLPGVAALMVCISCGKADVALPADVCGRWVTNDKRYEDRYLVITNEEIRFGTGGPELAAFPVMEIEKSGTESDVRYKVTYRAADGRESILTFDHMVQSGTIRLASRPHLTWRKASVRQADGDS